MPKTKEDRSDWVAVAPEFSSTSAATIRPAQSAYAFFQKQVGEAVKQELIQEWGKFEVGKYSRAVRDKWNALGEQERSVYDELAQQDAMRFRSESHLADVAAMERRERLRNERNQILVVDDDGARRSTRARVQKKLKKQKRRAEKQKRRKSQDEDDDYKDDDDDDDEGDDDDEYEQDSSSSSSYDSDDSRPKPKKPKKAPPPRKVSQKQIEYREKVRQEKHQKEQYIAGRQQDLRKEKAAQANRRLDFLLKQSNIFSHFGAVQQDQARYGIKATNKDTSGESSRRESVGLQDDNAALEEADEHEATYLTSQPSTLGHGTMRPYQLEGLNWMIRLQENGINGILADEMGLGKTLQSVSVLVYMLEYRNENGPHLIVVPKSTLSNWMNELRRWGPTLVAIKFHGNKAEREQIVQEQLKPGQRDEDRKWNVVVTTYELCGIEKNVLNKFAWSYLIIDEAHRLKNEASAFSRTIRTFETRYRILLTGTPLQNSLHELWALLNFLVPDVFASAEQFDEWFNLDIDDDDEKNKLISQLHKILRPFMLRRLKADVETSLPPKHETILFTGMSAMQKKLYRDILIRDIDAIQGTGGGGRTAILNIVMQLRKCAGHPYLFPGVEDRSLPPLGDHLVDNCGKMVLLDKLLRRLKERGHRVLLFTQMTRVLDIMEDYLVMRQYKYCRIDGNTSYEMREDYIDAYNAPNSEKFIFLLSTRAGGLGINLQTADVVILYDSDWNPQADLQAQDRAHRIGQKKEVQIFRLVTEHTIEEKIVERAQQKLKLDAMVVQQGRFKDKDKKLSREELLEAVRFGADKIFKSKDSSITDDDIDMILDAGKKKTQELNDKLKAAEKGDLLDFKLDGSTSVQTFEGVDYSSSALAQAKAEAELLGIIDMGKRERRTVANYNENLLYQQQIAGLHRGAPQKPKKKKEVRLPKHLRIPRMEEWQMFDRQTLLAIQDEEEKAFRALPEEVQKAAIAQGKGLALKPEETKTDTEKSPDKSPGEQQPNSEEAKENEKAEEPSIELPPLTSDENIAKKTTLLAEGFTDWTRAHYRSFIEASARYGRTNLPKIAKEVGKTESEVEKYASAFWGETGKERFSKHEYEKVVKLIERGEKKIDEMQGLERGTKVFVSLFDDPWQELEFTHVNCKDKMFTMEEDRYLLCWAYKFGYGQWGAVKMAIRRHPNFRFDYFLRSLPTELLGRRCEQLMKLAGKEVEHLEREARKEAGLPFEPKEGEELPPIQLPKFKEMQKKMRLAKKMKAEEEKKLLKAKVEQIEDEIRQIEEQVRELNGTEMMSLSVSRKSVPLVKASRTAEAGKNAETSGPAENAKGAAGPGGEFIEFPEYDGSEPPKEHKKPFTHFCNGTRKEVKAELGPKDRKDKQKVNAILKERWLELSEDEKNVWREWSSWDKKRHARDLAVFNRRSNKSSTPDIPPVDDHVNDAMDTIHVPKKRSVSTGGDFSPSPKRSKRSRSH